MLCLQAMYMYASSYKVKPLNTFFLIRASCFHCCFECGEWWII